MILDSVFVAIVIAVSLYGGSVFILFHSLMLM